MPQRVLEVLDLTKIYYVKNSLFSFKSEREPYIAVDGISFYLNEGETLGILGPNGAGKTTTIQMLLGVLQPTSGQIFYFGKDFFTNRSASLQCVTHASAFMKMPLPLTVQENLDIFGRLYGLSKEARLEKIDRLLCTFEIEHIKNRQVYALSSGQVTRVMLVKAFLSDPKIVLLDEPTASLDPEIAYITRKFLREQKQERKISMIVTSHNMPEVAEICDRVLVINKGKIIQEDTPQMLAKSVSISILRLRITSGMDLAISFIEEKWEYFAKDHKLSVEIDEHAISELLQQFAKANVTYSDIEIEKPSLEDYFLDIMKKGSSS